jgi:hypothetical protein
MYTQKLTIQPPLDRLGRHLVGHLVRLPPSQPKSVPHRHVLQVLGEKLAGLVAHRGKRLFPRFKLHIKADHARLVVREHAVAIGREVANVPLLFKRPDGVFRTARGTETLSPVGAVFDSDGLAVRVAPKRLVVHTSADGVLVLDEQKVRHGLVRQRLL